jgi:hypothetical protein
MAETVRIAIRELVESMLETLEILVTLADDELLEPSDHVCAQGKDVWTLVTNDIDHEKIHAGQILEGRYEARATQGRMARVASEWLDERSRLVGSLVGLSDEQFDSPTAEGAWTYRQVVEHVLEEEQDSLRSIREAIEQAESCHT